MRARQSYSSKGGGSTMLKAAENIGGMVARGTKTTGKVISKGKKLAEKEKKAPAKKATPAKPEKPVKPTKAVKAEKPVKEKPKASTSRKDGLPKAVDLSFDKW